MNDTNKKYTEFGDAIAKATADYKEHVAALDEKLKNFTAEINDDKKLAFRAYRETIENLEKKYAAS